MNSTIAMLQLGVNEKQSIATWEELFFQKIFDWKQLVIKNASNHLLLEKKILQLEKFYEAAHVLNIQQIPNMSIKKEIEITHWKNENLATNLAFYESAKAKILLILSNAYDFYELYQSVFKLIQLQKDFELLVYSELSHFLDAFIENNGSKEIEDVKIGEVLYSQDLLQQYQFINEASTREEEKNLTPLARELYRIKKVLEVRA